MLSTGIRRLTNTVAAVALWSVASLGPLGCLPADNGSGQKHHVAFLADVTDSAAAAVPQIQSVGTRVTEDLPSFAELSFFTIGAEQAPVCRFNATAPRHPDSARVLFDGKRELEKKRDREVARPLLAAIDSLAGMPDAPASPLFESIPHLMRTEWGRGDATREIHLVSDLLHHGDSFSLLRDPTSSPVNSKGELRNPRWAADLTGVRVHVYILRRQQYPHSVDALIRAWESYFKACGVDPDDLVFDPLSES